MGGHPAGLACRAANVYGDSNLYSLDVIAMRSDDGDELVLRVVNAANEPMKTEIKLKGFTPTKKTAGVTELFGGPDAVDTTDNPENVKPHERNWKHGYTDGCATVTFRPYSFTVIRLC